MREGVKSTGLFQGGFQLAGWGLQDSGAHTPNSEEWGTEEFMESCPVTQSKH